MLLGIQMYFVDHLSFSNKEHILTHTRIKKSHGVQIRSCARGVKQLKFDLNGRWAAQTLSDVKNQRCNFATILFEYICIHREHTHSHSFVIIQNCEPISTFDDPFVDLIS